jgi:hypothetical protein
MNEEEIYEKEKKYLRFINILIILNVFMVVVVVLIYINSRPAPKSSRSAVGLMPPNFPIRPIKNVDDAKSRTLEYIESLGLKGLALKRVIAFKNYYFVYVKENATNKTAFALKLNKLGTLELKKFPSMYPQMMWNHKYSHRAQKNEANIAVMLLSIESAKDTAIDVAEKLGASHTISKTPDTYYGFYEFIVFKNKVAVGEISINGATGKVFFKLYPNPPLEFNEYI